MTYTCDTCGHEFFCQLIAPSAPATRDDPAAPPEAAPYECPHCGNEVNAWEVEADERDAIQAARERAEEARAEMIREATETA